MEKNSEGDGIGPWLAGQQRSEEIISSRYKILGKIDGQGSQIAMVPFIEVVFDRWQLQPPPFCP
jgi:hypothetical protein